MKSLVAGFPSFETVVNHRRTRTRQRTRQRTRTRGR